MTANNISTIIANRYVLRRVAVVDNIVGQNSLGDAQIDYVCHLN